MEHTPRERALDLIHLLVPDWHPTTSQVLWSVRITIVSFLFLSIFELVGDYYSKTLWEVADLLIVPAAIAGGVAWFNHRQKAGRARVNQAPASPTPHRRLRANISSTGRVCGAASRSGAACSSYCLFCSSAVVLPAPLFWARAARGRSSGHREGV